MTLGFYLPETLLSFLWLLNRTELCILESYPEIFTIVQGLRLRGLLNEPCSVLCLVFKCFSSHSFGRFPDIVTIPKVFSFSQLPSAFYIFGYNTLGNPNRRLHKPPSKCEPILPQGYFVYYCCLGHKDCVTCIELYILIFLVHYFLFQSDTLEWQPHESITFSIIQESRSELQYCSFLQIYLNGTI